MEDSGIKQTIKQFWNKKPCGTFGVLPEEPDREYFAKIRERRYRLEPFIKNIADFPSLKNKRVLEIGCGIGIDGLEFVKAGARYIGIDASERSVTLAKKYFELSECGSQNILLADAEKLPFSDGEFDFVYSWGVIHHTPDIEKAVQEIKRVLKPGGSFLVMLYNRRSLVGCQLYLLYGLLRLKPLISWKELFYEHHESLGTKAYVDSEVRQLFGEFNNVKLQNIVTPYDLRAARNVFLPKIFRRLIPSGLGFFKAITGTRDYEIRKEYDPFDKLRVILSSSKDENTKTIIHNS